MELNRKLRSAFLAAACVYLVTVTATFSMAADKSPASGQKVKITGPIVVREGDMVQVLNWKDGSVQGFKVTGRTAIRCDKGFLRGKTAMNASALVPALTVEVEAISTSEGMAEAKTIRFNPDPFAAKVSCSPTTRASEAIWRHRPLRMRTTRNPIGGGAGPWAFRSGYRRTRGQQLGPGIPPPATYTESEILELS
jgi:hypothetical protein